MIDYVDAELFENDSLDKQIHIAISGTQRTLGNEDIISESFQLIESLCSEEYLKFGAIEPRCVKFTVKYSAPKLLNKWLTITMTLEGSETPFSFGDYQVTSDKPSADRSTRYVTAYSHYHKILKNTYKTWYNSIWTDGNTMTIKQFRDAFFQRLLQTHSWVVQEQTTLPNDDVVIRKSKKIPRISGKDILNAICEINGVFGYPARDNVFRYIKLNNSDTTTPIINSLQISSEYEDYETTTIDRVEILSQDGSLLTGVGESASDSENKYVVENNFLLKGLGNGVNAKRTATTLATNLLSVIENVNYVPFSSEIKGNPCFEIGDRISFQSHGTTVTTFITERTLKGTQSLHDEYSAEAGDAVYPEVMNPTDSKLKEIKSEIGNISDNSIGYDELPDIDDAVNEGDMFFAFKSFTNYYPKYAITHPDSNDGLVDSDFFYQGQHITFSVPGDFAWLDDFEWEGEAEEGDTPGYQYYINGAVYPNIQSNQYTSIGANGYYGEPVLALHGISAGRYKIYLKAKWTCTHPFDPTDPEYQQLAQIPGLSAWTNSKKIEDGVPSIACEFDSITHATEYTEYTFEQEVTSQMLNKPLYMWATWWWPIWPSEMNPKKAKLTMYVKCLRIEKIIDVTTGETDGGVTIVSGDNVDKAYVSTTRETSITRSRAVSENVTEHVWREIEFLKTANTSESSGLEMIGDQGTLTTKSDLMRAWVKADPPQMSANYNRFCVRYTGEPDSNIQISKHGGVEWTNRTLKRYDDGSYKIVCGGTKTSETVDYYAYKITGLTIGYSYYLNFAADFGINAQFGENTNKSLGVVFNTTGTISTDDYSGEPHTFDTETLYASFYRSNKKKYYDFHFEATAETMYMCVVLGDLLPCTTQLSFTEFVIAQSERRFIRKFYLYDLVQHEWLEYRPFGSTDSGGAVVSDSLSGLSDVSLSNVENGQILTYDLESNLWKNTTQTVVANPQEEATATLTKIKIGNVVYNVSGGGGTSSEVVTSNVTQSYSETVTDDYEIS